VTLEVWHLDVFAREPGGGNPCPIVLDADALDADQMQGIAAHYGAETGFVQHDADGELRLRYFVPRHEMSMCVHATVAAATVLRATDVLEASPVTVRTGSGDCVVGYTDDDPPLVTVEQQRPVLGPPLELPAGLLAYATGVPAAALDDRRPVRAVSVSRPKLIVALREAAAVHAAAPDLPALWDLCRGAESTGAYVFAPHADGRADHLVARQFPVDAGYPEDPATGVAAGALAAYLATGTGWHHFDIDQGDAMGRPSVLRASAFADAGGVRRSTVSGRAALRRREPLDLDGLART
jgi:PhzF family phenazine biosynthesis protein